MHFLDLVYDFMSKSIENFIRIKNRESLVKEKNTLTTRSRFKPCIVQRESKAFESNVIWKLKSSNRSLIHDNHISQFTVYIYTLFPRIFSREKA